MHGVGEVLDDEGSIWATEDRRQFSLLGYRKESLFISILLDLSFSIISHYPTRCTSQEGILSGFQYSKTVWNLGAGLGSIVGNFFLVSIDIISIQEQ